jgi:hypothetical protein
MTDPPVPPSPTRQFPLSADDIRAGERYARDPDPGPGEQYAGEAVPDPWEEVPDGELDPGAVPGRPPE